MLAPEEAAAEDDEKEDDEKVDFENYHDEQSTSTHPPTSTHSANEHTSTHTTGIIDILSRLTLQTISLDYALKETI